MGQSKNAILFWGYTWPDEETSKPWEIGKPYVEDDEEEEDDGCDWEDRYAAAMGLAAPDGGNYSSPEWASYWLKKEKLIKEGGCMVDTHCSGDCPMPYVAIKDSRVLAMRGDAVEIGEAHLTVNPFWRNDLDNFCRVMGIPIPQTEPRWYLVSDWN